MNTNIIKYIFAGAAIFYFIVQLCFYKFWQNKIKTNAGELVLKTTTPKNTKGIIVLILCPILVVLSIITRPSNFISCLMSAVSGLAFYITSRELVYSKLNGIYTNGLVGNGHLYRFDDIQTFPDTSWKEPEKQNTTSLAIQLKPIKKQQSAVTFIDYATISEYSKVVAKIKEMKKNK
ncbi:hypothetical protein [Treponema sp.]|uniref:hypothetical protein n=1 Tax=Treponema sp. TaxID=166 RepID=UPI00298DD906|nr:hypothetical protein [Treponema sp.]MCR5612739.1 hypothetical protein [Treponema sp.]